jgi:hypothetical protein
MEIYTWDFSYVGNNVILGDNAKIPQLFYWIYVVIGNALLFAGAKIYQRLL